MLKNKLSFSLVEVLVFATILSIFFVTASSVVIVALRNMKFNENKVLALHYSEQLEDWLLVRKDIDWGGNQCSAACCSDTCNFTERVTQDGLNTSFCFNTSPILDWPTPDASGCDGVYSLGSLFLREVSFSSTPVAGYIGQVTATITVAWEELGQQKNITTNVLYSIPEE